MNDKCTFCMIELHSLAAQHGANNGPLPALMDAFQCGAEVPNNLETKTAFRAEQYRSTAKLNPKLSEK
ncbi:hypothetical protein [Ahrensia kielensis]|uniref:hypothetical protein n=1 Tax=Ahrensia kielensis TaxID=76980 RepID=UPI00036E8F06|nr:hypothetical protein [Ahrensia kielensis]